MGSAGGPPALAAFDGDLGGHGTTEAGEKAVADHLHTMEDSVRDATDGPTRDTIVMESAGGQPALAGFDDDLSENSLAGMADDCCDCAVASSGPGPKDRTFQNKTRTGQRSAWVAGCSRAARNKTR